MRKAALHNLGCKVNSYETEAMQQLLEASGSQIVDFEEKADVYIINTCSVTNVADKKSRQMLHRAKAKNPEALVVAAGCYAQAAGEKLLEDTAHNHIVKNAGGIRAMKIMDCTLRDGANVLGNGFPEDLTVLILNGLTENGVSVIEYGNAKGLGAETLGFEGPVSDARYFELAQPYLDKAEVGMFLNAKRYKKENVEHAAKAGLAFLRVGADAGDAEKYTEVIRTVKDNGLKCRYSLMKAYLLNPEELAEEALKLQNMGVDEVTIMDSAGCMLPDEVKEYVKALKNKVSIPVGFHCHNNLGMSAANAQAAMESGVDLLDCGLLGMARSAGNLATEVAAALAHKVGEAKEVNFYGLLNYLEKELIPAMEKHGYEPDITPLELILGYSGCHSSFVKKFKAIAAEYGVDVKELIVEVSKIDRKSPSEELMKKTAETLKEAN